MMRTGNVIGGVVVAAALVGLSAEAVDSFGRARASRAAAGSSGASAASTVIEGFAFAPMHIAVGGEVTWSNGDGAAHTIVADDGSFASPLLERNATFSHRFERPGTFTYVCTVHPQMTGHVEVAPTPDPMPSPTADPYGSSGG